MQLTQHFSLEEMTITQVRGVDNTPPPEIAAHLVLIAAALEKVRTMLGDKPILVNSGYRSAEVNARVGGVPNSAHLYGYAADFICPSFGKPIDICRMIAWSDPTVFSFDQLIEEGTWVHLSVDPKMRREVLTKNPAGGYRPGIPEGQA